MTLYADSALILTDCFAPGARIDIMNHKREPPLWLACLKGKLDVVEVLLTAGAHLKSCSDCEGWGPMHAAVLHGSTQIVDRLIHAGLDLHQPNRHGQQSIHLACRRGQDSDLTLLLLEVTAHSLSLSHHCCPLCALISHSGGGVFSAFLTDSSAHSLTVLPPCLLLSQCALEQQQMRYSCGILLWATQQQMCLLLTSRISSRH